MRLEMSNRTDLALKAFAHLDLFGEAGGRSIAEAIATTANYLPQVLKPLIVESWIRGTPGPGGGYQLCADLNSFSLLNVIEAMEGKTEESSGNAAAGEEVYDSTCVACHAADATGITGLGKDLTNSDFINGMSDDELVAFLKVGRSASDPDNTTGVEMPVRGGNPSLSDDDLNDVAAFLRTLQGN